jgi:predicted hydrolase (HD superfamily)
LAPTREEALALLHRHIQNERTRGHSLATEAVMRALALRFDEEPDFWGMTGLLHDLDLEIVGGDLTRHALVTEEILKGEGYDADMIAAIKSHNDMLGTGRETTLQHALAAGETITGLIMATAMVYPDRKLASVKAKSVVKRMKERAFAASVNRETILECEKIGIPLAEFAQLCLEAMREISDDLGL